jgi:hypothetical protein
MLGLHRKQKEQGIVESMRAIALAIFLAGSSMCGCAAEVIQHTAAPNRRNSEMSMTIAVSFIVRINGEQVETDKFGTLKCSDRAMLQDLSFYFSNRAPVTIEFDKKSGQIASVSSAPTDVLVVLSPKTSAEPRVAVHLRKRPTVLYLEKSNPRFEQLYALLQEAFTQKRQVHLAVLAGDSLIEDVRIEVAKQ